MRGGKREGAGRPKGKPNKSTAEIKKLIEGFIGSKIDELDEVWKQLEPKDKMKALQDLLKFAIPTQIRSSIDLNNISDEDLLSLTEDITEKLCNNE